MCFFLLILQSVATSLQKKTQSSESLDSVAKLDHTPLPSVHTLSHQLSNTIMNQSTPILDLEEGSILSKDTLNTERWNDSIEDEKKLECLVRLQTIHSKQKFHNSCCVCIIML